MHEQKKIHACTGTVAGNSQDDRGRKTQREIAEHYGFKDKEVVKEALKRERRKERTIPKQRGRKPAKTLAEYKYENQRLRMENELLRDFLQSIERK